MSCSNNNNMEKQVQVVRILMKIVTQFICSYPMEFDTQIR